MSRIKNFQNELIIEGRIIMSDKDSDGKMRSIDLIMDPDYNKEDFEALESRNYCYMLKYYDRWNSNYWNCCAGSYFCEEEFL